jgi:hypothetical protein
MDEEGNPSAYKKNNNNNNPQGAATRSLFFSNSIERHSFPLITRSDHLSPLLLLVHIVYSSRQES